MKKNVIHVRPVFSNKLLCSKTAELRVGPNNLNVFSLDITHPGLSFEQVS
jgi:hypothetical protein